MARRRRRDIFDSAVWRPRRRTPVAYPIFTFRWLAVHALVAGRSKRFDGRTRVREIPFSRCPRSSSWAPSAPCSSSSAEWLGGIPPLSRRAFLDPKTRVRGGISMFLPCRCASHCKSISESECRNVWLIDAAVAVWREGVRYIQSCFLFFFFFFSLLRFA